MKSISQVKVILASTAPWRSQVLLQAGIEHRAMAPRLVEPPYERGPVEAYVQSLALQKAASLAQDFPSAIVLGFDQMAVCEGRVMGKPGSHEAAREQLQWLRGREHSLFNGVALIYRGEEITLWDEARLWMRHLSDQEIENYLNREKPYGCAGSYRIEGIGGALFERVQIADMHSIVGLPLNLVHVGLARLGYSVLI